MKKSPITMFLSNMTFVLFQQNCMPRYNIYITKYTTERLKLRVSSIFVESTMNKGFKLKSGWLAILNNEKQLLSNTRNVTNINRVRRAVHHHANRKRQGKGRHADCSSSKMKKYEQAVQDISSCLTTQ